MDDKTLFSNFFSSRKDPREYLKDATRNKSAGDLNGAINCLQKAYKLISKTPTNFGVDPYLRLPLYLQQAGRSDDAWREFNKLLVHGYPNQIKTRELIPMDNSAIYDKMRLFLQRENRMSESVKMGVLSYISWGIGLYYQKREQELKEYMSEPSIVTMIEGLLIRANIIDCKLELINLVIQEISKLPTINMAGVGKEVDKIVCS